VDKELRPVDVLAIGAHPDDVELCAGGTVVKMVRQGRSVGVVDLTRGELGTRGTPEIRAREAARAGELMGVSFRTNLSMPDGHLVSDPSSRVEIVRVFRACRPRLVITHSQTGHPDHWAAAQLVREASYLSGLVRIDTGQDRFRPGLIAGWLQCNQTDQPDVVVDISEVIDEKERIYRAYRSQLHDPSSQEPETYLTSPDFMDQIRSHNRYLGTLADCAFAEGFVLSRYPRLDDLSMA